MSDNLPINRALAAAQLAKEQQHAPQTVINPKATTMLNEVLAQKNTPTTAPESIPQKPQSVFLNKSANSSGASSKSAPKTPMIVTGLGDTQKESGEDAKFTKVELSIAGTTHRINCPVGDVMTINRVAEQISDSLRELRRTVRGKSPSNEELLVLHCLDLYDQLRELNEQTEKNNQESKQASELLDKLLKDIGNVGSASVA